MMIEISKLHSYKNKVSSYVEIRLLCAIVQLLLILITALLAIEQTSFSYDDFIHVCRVSVPLVVASIVLLIICNGGPVKPASIIMYSFCAFQFGIPLVIALDPTYTDYVIVNIPSDVLVSCSWYSIICIEAYSFGSIIASKKREKIQTEKNTKQNKMIKLAFDDRKSVARIAMYLFIACGIIAYFYMLWFAQLSITSGIAYAREVIGSNAIRNISRGFFIPSGIIYLIFSENIQGKKWVFVLMLVYGIIGTISGDRTESMTLLVALAYYYGELRENSRFSFQSKLVMMIVLVVILFSLPIVAQTRIGNTVSIAPLTEQLKSVFAETGYNFYSICYQSMYNNNLQYGASYIVALLALVPSSLMPSFVTTYMQTVLPAYWIDSVMQTHYAWATYGQGYSMIAESFYNFGSVGFITIAIFGYIIQRIIQDSLSTNELFSKYLSVVLLWSFLTVPRRGFEFMVNAIEYNVLFIILLFWIVASFTDKKKRLPYVVEKGQKKGWIHR